MNEINAFSSVPLNRIEEQMIDLLNVTRKDGEKLLGAYMVVVTEDKDGHIGTNSAYAELGMFEMSLVKGTLEYDIFQQMLAGSGIAISEKVMDSFKNKMGENLGIDGYPTDEEVE